MMNDKADLVVINLDPGYPQESVEAMIAPLRDTRVISAVEQMVPLDAVFRRINQGEKTGLFEWRRVHKEFEKLIVQTLTVARKRPTKRLVILVPPYIQRDHLAMQACMVVQAEAVACTGSD
jgi:hypothetical protein